MTFGVIGAIVCCITTVQARPTICIDPGHPSEVGIGTKGKLFREVDVNWKVAKLLKGKLESDGYVVVLTKSSAMEKVLNRRRAEIANRSNASLMLRLHCDAASGSGFAVYYPAKEGTWQRKKGPSKWVRDSSHVAAKAFHSGMAASLNDTVINRGIKTDRDTAVGKRQGALTGSIFSQVPVILVEMVVLTNPVDEDFLRSKDGFERLAEGLRQGVRKAVPLSARGNK